MKKFFFSSGHSPRSMNGSNGKSSNALNLPFLSQIAEEDLTSASTSVTSFHLATNTSRRNLLSTLPPHRALSDQDLFTRVNNDLGQDLSASMDKPVSYSHFNFEQLAKQQLTKGNSLASMSSDSVDTPINNGDVTRRKTHRTTSPNGSTAASSPAFFNTPVKNKGTLRKQTQNIAARAAQRRANLHHKEVMEDMGKKLFEMKIFIDNHFFLGSVFSSEPMGSNENTTNGLGLDMSRGKPKKTVTINDYRRTNSESPDLAKIGKTLPSLSFL